MGTLIAAFLTARFPHWKNGWIVIHDFGLMTKTLLIRRRTEIEEQVIQTTSAEFLFAK